MEIRRPKVFQNQLAEDLNYRPSDYKSDALPTELRQRRAQTGE